MHFHTAFSLLDGVCSINGSIQRADELGMSSLAITDHGVLYGIADFYLAAKKKGIKPIIGCETYVAHGSMHARERRADKKVANHLVLLAENEVGYYNLVHLISKANLEGFYYKPRIDKELLSQHAEGLIGLSACLQGEVSEWIKFGKPEKAIQAAGEYADIFGKDNFFLEMEDHGIPEQRQVNRLIPEIAKKTGLGLVATNDVHYLKKEHAEAHDVMLCLQTQSLYLQPNRMRYPGNEFYMKSSEEMWEIFGEVPSALENTVKIAKRCNLELKLNMEEIHFPTYELPKGVDAPKDFIIELAAKGMSQHYNIDDIQKPKNEEEKKIVDRLFYEVSILEKTGFINYFLVVQDFINYAKEKGIAVGPGRGSGAGSILAYTLGITGIDPLYYNLVFERFMNPERVSPPDFDIDFCQARRDEVIDYVREKYGHDYVAQIITFNCIGAKTFIRDIGRVLEIPLPECDKLAKLIPEVPKITIEEAKKQSPEFRKMADTNLNAQRILKYAEVIEGLPRQPGVHAAGVVIGEKPLIEILPLGRDKSGVAVTQFEKIQMENTGLLKMDFLGLKTLTVIQETLKYIKKAHGIDIDIDNISLEDEITYQMMQRGDTVCVFQIESKGMRELLRNLGPTCIEDLIALIALYRPGPMDMIPDFIARKHGRVPITYDHPLLEEVLKETYGVMVYQEQVQLASNLLAGFTLGEGDILRKAMGKKKPETMREQREKFIKGCKETNQIDAKKAGDIFDHIQKFAGYGFNKAHSAAYGVISYQTAYLKAHYPVEFMAANMTLELNNSDKIENFIKEAHKMDIEVLPPCVNESYVTFRPIDKKIRFGLAGVKNVGEAAVTMLVEEREKNGPYTGLIDFCKRLDSKVANKKMVESLVTCGAFDFAKTSRGRMFSAIEFAMNRASAEQKDLRNGQSTLFAMFEPTADASAVEKLPEAPAWSEHQMLKGEKELLGFYISGHPLSSQEWILKHFITTKLIEAGDVSGGAQARFGGLVTQFRKMFTKRDQRPMASFVLEGLEGAIDVIVFPDTYETYGHLLEEEATIMIGGEMDQQEGPKLKASEIYALHEAPGFFAKKVFVHIPEREATTECFERLKKIMLEYPGKTEVSLCVVFAGGEKVFVSTSSSYHIRPCEQFVHEVNQLLGEQSTYIDIIQKPCLQEPQRKRWNKKPANNFS